jgi:hypothetical protein
MQLSHTARLAAAVALACATMAHGATAVKAATATASTRSASGTTASAATAPVLVNSNGTFTRSSTAIQSPAAPAPAPSTNTTPTPTPTAPTNTTTVDLRDQATRNAVAGTHASGSTSALGPFANGTVANSTAGTGTTSGAGATGTGSSTGGTTTTTTTGNGAFGTIGGASVIGGGAVVGSNGVIVVPAGNPSDVTILPPNSGTVLAQGLAASDVNAGSVLIADANAPAMNGVSVDRAINQVSRDRKRVGRNGQLLYSVAPRTNVDRSWQMPDDGPSPALTGSNSTLTR